MYKNTIFRDISQDPLIPWVAVIKTDAVHNAEVGKVVLIKKDNQFCNPKKMAEIQILLRKLTL